MRLEKHQKTDESGQPQIKRMVRTLTLRRECTDDEIRLTPGWFEGCMFLGYLFLGIAFVLTYTIINSLGSDSVNINWWLLIPAILVMYGLALGMFSTRTFWKITREHVERRSMVPMLSKTNLWSAKDVTAILVVEQGAFRTRFQMFAPGIWLMTKGGYYDLGANGSEEGIHEFARELSAFYDVPYENHVRAGILTTFRKERRKYAFIIVPIAVGAIALLAWLQMR